MRPQGSPAELERLVAGSGRTDDTARKLPGTARACLPGINGSTI